MAITPRTIFTNPASAALAAASLFTVTAAGMYALNTSCASSPCELRAVEVYESPCASVHESLGYDKSTWSEYGWFTYAECYSEQNASSKVVDVTTQGLRHYPASEALYNMKGYHQIKLGDHADAVKTLEEGIRRVGRTSSGVMANNLAWAGVWAPREMESTRARQLYRQSLAQNPNVCETIHTGMWVEYAISKKTDGFERAAALRAFQSLASDYEACEGRYQNGEWDTLVEVLGAAVIKADVASDLDCGMKVASEKELLRDVSVELRKRYRGASIDALCRESIPVSAAHHACVDLIDTQVTALRRARR
jgi:hypothetical protein